MAEIKMPEKALSALVNDGSMIEAMRQVQITYKMGLLEAKMFVEKFLMENNDVYERFQAAGICEGCGMPEEECECDNK